MLTFLLNTIFARPDKVTESIPEEMVAETEQPAEPNSEDSANQSEEIDKRLI